MAKRQPTTSDFIAYLNKLGYTDFKRDDARSGFAGCFVILGKSKEPTIEHFSSVSTLGDNRYFARISHSELATELRILNIA